MRTPLSQLTKGLTLTTALFCALQSAPVKAEGRWERVSTDEVFEGKQNAWYVDASSLKRKGSRVYYQEALILYDPHNGLRSSSGWNMKTNSPHKFARANLIFDCSTGNTYKSDGVTTGNNWRSQYVVAKDKYQNRKKRLLCDGELGAIWAYE